MFSSFALALAALAAVAYSQSGPCNGFDELCSRRYSNVTFAASHNAAFVGRLPQHNQYEYPEQGMGMGIRYFTTQVHIEDGEIRQCHSDCALLNVGLFSEIVVSLTSWLKDHPREVVTLLVTNGDDNILIEEFAPIFEAAGAVDLAFVPDSRLSLDDWPTLGELIAANSRLIVFMDYNADTSKVPYILAQYDYYVETPFSPTEDNFFNCDIDRPDGGSSKDRMIFANHNLNLDLFGLLLPDQDAAEETNSVSNIKQQTDICIADHGRVPNVVMLDFVTKGEVIEAQKQLNGL
ncbi:PLC-like phosphodiesterase [Sarocladium strictum]